ncbi:hypothetical protein LXA43DRAFT_1166250 [Ganoderma leucocontextum]|nr:hypothetical protein LXA43DRAFT_1166250 [Ganoderma leucocontextum]
MHHPYESDDPASQYDRLQKVFPHILWTAVTVSTSFAVLYGLFVTLAVVSVYVLLRRGTFRRLLSAIQLFAVTALLVSTTTHWAVVVLQRFGSVLAHPNTTVEANKHAFLPEQCVGTATLTINIILSDVVVWWRVWVLWRDNRSVLVSGCVLLLATFATGIVDTTFSCNAQGGFMYEGLLVGTMASALSLATNLAATVLIAHKAWVHRRCIRSHVASGPRSTLVEGVLTLLVESGALYCTLWVVVVVWQIGSTIDDPHLRSSVFFSPKFSGNHWHRHGSGSSFWFDGGVLIEGCLVPLIAIYPTVIIVLVALNKSAVENGMKHDVTHLPAITVTVEMVVDMQRDVEDGVRRSPSSKAESISDVSLSEKRLEGDLEAARMS